MLKVFDLAKELNVDGKAIVEKCKAEGIENVTMTRHPVGPGLAATIREWASRGELPPPSAATKSRSRRSSTSKKGQSAGAESGNGDEGGGTATAVEEPPPGDGALSTEEPPERPAPRYTAAPDPGETRGESGRPHRAKAKVEIEAPIAEAGEVSDVPQPAIEQDLAPAPSESLRPAATAVPATPPAPVAPVAPVPPVRPVPPVVETPQAPVKPVRPVQARGVPNVVARPQVTPVGTRNVPLPAQLQGPKVVRMEQADNLPAPRSRPRPQQTSTQSNPMAPGTRGAAAGAPPSASPSRGRQRGAGPAPAADEEEGRSPRRKGRPVRRAGRAEDVNPTELIREWREADLVDRAERLAAATGGLLKERRREMNKSQARGQVGPAQRPSHVELELPISVRELSEAMGVKTADLVKKLMAQGTMATVNQSLEPDTAQMLALEFGVELVIKAQESAFMRLEKAYREKEETAEKSHRPPVVTILGHVDHGKTSLLDKIRSTNVAAGEAGGITQHVGAYTVSITGSDGQTKRVTFLDTPGHQAFTAMRARGANVTDVVVLVVAADDGVMPQTVESINHAKAAGVPIVVALNKIDKPEANPNKVLGQLAEQGLNPSEWGGDTEVVRTSAVSGQGIHELIEYLDYVATLRDLKASPQLPARGSVIEAFMDPLRGVVARVLVQNGTLRPGDPVVCGSGYGRARQLLDDKKQSVEDAGPSTPVELIGLDAVPGSGDRFYVVEDLPEAKSIAEERSQSDRAADIAQRSKVTLENLFDTIKQGQVRELPMILKTDVQGSLDVLRQTMTEQLSQEVKVNLLHSAVGGISESDVMLAEASGAVIVGFGVVPDETARKMAETHGVEIRLYRIIYEITDDIRKALSGMLAPTRQDQILGHADVRQVIRISRVGNVAGCMVSDGVLQRAAKYRLIRDGVVVAENLALDSLKRFKEDAKEVRGGLECGIKVANFDDIKTGDRFEAYKIVDVARSL